MAYEVRSEETKQKITVAASASGIRDNLSRGSVGGYLKEHLKAGSSLSVVSAYFTIYAYHALKAQLDVVNQVDFLFGEPRFLRSLDPEKTDKRSFQIEDTGLTLSNRLEQRRVAKECAEWLRDKVRVRSVKQSNLLHGKMYHIAQGGQENAILGSSNFTMRGLGLSESGSNIELNLEVDSNRDRRDLKTWFDELWSDSAIVEDVKGEVLSYLAQLYANHSPEFIYYKTLFHLFGEFLDEQHKSDLLSEQSQLIDSDVWQALFEFQKDGVKGAINKILKHGGCILADSVGLGKTYEALGVIKYFEQRNHRVLVLCPKKLRENWTVYQAHNNSELNPFIRDRFGYTVLSHTDLSRDGGMSGDVNLATINWGNYDLVVIDESHNFRNNSKGKKDEDGRVIRQSRYERLMADIIQSGVKTKVLLLSATPVNNDLKDLRNQLYFITEGKEDAFRESLGIPNLKDALAAAQRSFSEWAKQGHHDSNALLERLSAGFFKLLDELTIARSRKHIQRYYPEVMKQLGGFPERLKPVSVYSEIDTEDMFPTYDRLNDEISEYRLSLFNPTRYVLPEYRERYEDNRVGNFSQDQREHYLIGMMKVNFLKRLESSVASFGVTMQRTVEKIDALIDQIEDFQERRLGDLEVNIEELQLSDVDDEDLRDVLQVGKRLKFNLAHMDAGAWLDDLKADKRQLRRLYLSAHDVDASRDAKLRELKRLIETKVTHPTRNKHGEENKKVIVFTAFADTAEYLYRELSAWATEQGIHSALVVGTGTNRTTFGRSEFQHILMNFSPKAKRRAKLETMPKDGEINLLIATDCISEGQNLQDCDYLVNYDIHWNPVRIIQRFGRIDRIGSANTAIQLVNFWPTDDLNAYINLKNRVEARMALVDLSATAEDNLLRADDSDLETLIESELRYRDQQLLRLREEVLDLEDFNESVSLSEFTLDDFRIDLVNFLESNRRKLEDAPLGLYTVVPAPKDHPVIRPGTVFCLEQKRSDTDRESNKAINPLHPYYLVYVRDDGEVRFSFAQPKQILDIYRSLCVGKPEALEALCQRFDEATQNGSDITHYSKLIDAAVDSLSRTYKSRAAGALKQRGGLLPTKQSQVDKTTDFNLVTWLVIKGAEEWASG